MRKPFTLPINFSLSLLLPFLPLYFSLSFLLPCPSTISRFASQSFPSSQLFSSKLGTVGVDSTRISLTNITIQALAFQLT